MLKRSQDAASSPRQAASRSRVIAHLQSDLESHGWLVFRDARECSPFALIALGSPQSAPVGRSWPPGLRWVGMSLSARRDGPAFDPDELRDLARAYGGRACFVELARAGGYPVRISW